jgi:hypothetical protein
MADTACGGRAFLQGRRLFSCFELCAFFKLRIAERVARNSEFTKTQNLKQLEKARRRRQ